MEEIVKQRAVIPTEKLLSSTDSDLLFQEIIARDTYIGTLRGILYDLTFDHTEEEIEDLKTEVRYYLEKTSYNVFKFDPEVKEYLNDWND